MAIMRAVFQLTPLFFIIVSAPTGCAQAPHDIASGINLESICADYGYPPRSEAESRSVREACEKRETRRISNMMDVPECVRQGGMVQLVGMAQNVMCVVPYPDAGKPCRNSSDCEGACLAKRPVQVQVGERTTGECERNNNPFGCRDVLENGISTGSVCRD